MTGKHETAAMAELVCANLRYDAETGVLSWLRPPVNRWAKAGDQAGFMKEAGYRRIGLGGVTMYAHRVAWLLGTGAWPEVGKEIDHINGNRDDNRLSNLRLDSGYLNKKSHRVPPGVSGYRGVSPKKRRWEAKIHIDGRLQYLGRYDDPVEAATAYDRAATAAFGTFATLNFPGESK